MTAFRTILNHLQEPSSESEGRPPQLTFRQYYHVSPEFYKPGGPIILWIPGESPLHSLFLHRGLAYELANATSGLLVALEHRFYGNSIPRYQDSLTGGVYNHRSDFEMRTTRRKTRFHGQSDAMRAWLSTSRHHGIKSEPELSKLKAAPKIRTSEPSLADAQPTPTTSTGKEGLPLDMLKYLSVDQAIEDIAYFMDNFPKLQPAFFAQPKPEAQTSPANAPKPNLRTNTTRWILTGCSYSGNLAAWTRQRYPNKVFAAFASSAPVRSALDFFEYTTSQTDILGKQCSSNLSLARDFLDSALQMTDEFMGHMALDAHGDDLSENKDNATETFDGSPIQPVDGEVNNSTLPLSNKAKDQHARQAAKLKVLSWFSPDFARDYALDGEEAHAAGWVWWTVASAVQYNTVVSPPSSAIGMEPRTTVDILCDTMALAHSSSPESSVSPIRYAKALATWFKDQQYFTPTKTEDLQPSDLDPNSAQNLAGIAWLWQTCSELGYLQTAQPSSCCCPPSSLPLAEALMTSYGANTFAGGSTALNLGNSFRNLTTTCGWDDIAMFSGDELSYPAVCKTLAPSHNQPMRMEGPVTTSQATTCQPCQCFATNTAKDESVFSRLLTLEAAWQDCQLYFGNPKGGTGIYSAASAPSPQPGVSGDGSYGAKTIVENNAHPNPLLTLSQSQSSSSSCLKQSSLLKGYPDVERNVNQKFHGWEIAQDQDPLPKQTQEDQHLFDDPVMTLIQQGQPPSHPLLQPSSQMHHSGRYYFTNGENDPWKELTLASAKAQEYLRINRVTTNRRRRPRPAEQDPSEILSESFLRSRTRTHHHRHRKPRHHHRRNRSARHVLPQELVDRLAGPDSQPEVVENAKETNTEDESAAMSGDTQEHEQNVIRIIPGASHCQDILYESTDQSSAALWTERQLVLKTFVRWIENDIQREKLEMMS
ncbi:Thymus-specific serine protease [Podila clonocystis]|nr:Thymus-specific serine protease [Podila clonocystis]